MGKFLNFLLESNNKNDEIENNENESNFINEADSSTDPHEIMTACFCAMNDDEFKDSNPNNKTEIELNEIINKIHTIAQTKKIVGQNDKEINSIIKYNGKYNALAQAYSAAILIRNKFNDEVKDDYCRHVILTGRSSGAKDFDKFFGIENLKNFFGIDSRGMKGFNSSDIILTNKSEITTESDSTKKNYFYGISLKKKSSDKEANPTLINASFLNAIDKGLSTKDDKTNVLRKIRETIGKFFSLIISEDEFIKKFINNNAYTNVINSLNEKTDKNFASLCAEANIKPENWKTVLSNDKGLLSIDDKFKDDNGKEKPYKDLVRNYINKKLSNGEKSLFSEFKTILSTNLGNGKKISNELAILLIDIIYKGSLKNLIKNNFYFALCIGKGSYNKNKCTVENGDFYQIAMIETAINKLKKGVPNLELNEIKEGKSTDNKKPAKIFLDLNIEIDNKNMKIADIQIRYKGSYTSSPQFFATMSKEFKTFLTETTSQN